MISARFTSALVAGVMAVGIAATASAQQPDRRGARSAPAAPAQTPTNQALFELLREIEALQSQVRDMRGRLEVQEHELERLKSRQQQALADFDRRVRELERRAATSGGGAANNGSPPPVIVTPPVGGNAAAPSPRTTPAPAPAPRAAPSSTEQQQYDAAFGLMKQGLYEQAAKSFREFVARNPKGALADNAQYWVGEAAYVTRDFRTALEEFGKVVTVYPQSAKVPDALLKIGYTHYELGAHDRARETLNQVVARYPNTVVAKSAELRLERMAKEGQ